VIIIELTKSLMLSLAVTFVLSASAFAQETKAPAAAEIKSVTYATDIKPIFEARCVRCHSSEKYKDGLHLNTLKGVLKGVPGRKIVTPGDSAKSFLVEYSSRHWPYKQLTPEQNSLIKAWVDQGAKWGSQRELYAPIRANTSEYDNENE
jgi:uncharacterized membrane protein